MPDFDTLQNAARAEQIRRCLAAMTDVQINRGLTAFDDGASCWSSCFWARVFEETNLSAIARRGYVTNKGREHSGEFAIEWWLADQLGLASNMPVRIVYNLFDGVARDMPRAALADFIRKARLEGDHDASVLALIASISHTKFDSTPDWNALTDDVRSNNPGCVPG